MVVEDSQAQIAAPPSEVSSLFYRACTTEPLVDVSPSSDVQGSLIFATTSKKFTILADAILVASGSPPASITEVAIDEVALTHFDIIGISPNTKWLAYYEKGDSSGNSVNVTKIHLLSSDKQTISYPFSLPTGYIETNYTFSGAYWINNELLSISLRDSTESVRFGPRVDLLFDPFTAEWQPFVQFPQYENRKMYLRSIFSPDTQKLVFVDSVNLAVTIWDYETEQAVQIDELSGTSWGVTSWSPDSRTVLLNDSITTMAFIYEKQNNLWQRRTQFDVSDSDGLNPAWSNSGTQVIFQKGQHIYIYNRTDNVLTKICALDGLNFAQPRWSPDENQIAFVSKADDGEYLLILNLVDGTIEQVHFSQQISLLGWTQDVDWQR